MRPEAPAVLFKGICRVHRAQVMQIRGAWTQAQDEAERVCRDVAHIHVGIVRTAPAGGLQTAG